MSLDWAVEVWNLPHNSPHEILLGEIPDLVAVELGKTGRDGGDVTVTLPADDPNLDVVCDPDASPPVSTLLRVYLIRGGVRTFVGAWLAEERSRPFEDDEGERWVEISGPSVDDVTNHGAVPPYDYPENPSSAPDWSFGGDGTSAGTFANGDMESIGGELLSNGGFEDGNLGNWVRTSDVGGPGVNVLEVSTNRPRTGAYSVFLDPFFITDSGIRYPNIAVKPGSRYVFTAWLLHPNTVPDAGGRWTARVKTGADVTIHNPGVGGVWRVGAGVHCELDNVAKGTGATISGGPSGDNSVWQSFTIDVTMGDFRESEDDETQLTYVEIAWDDTDPAFSGSPPVYIDDVSLASISNDDFTPWRPYTDSTVTLALETGTVHGGTKALAFTATAFTVEGFPTGVQQEVGALTPGDPYTFGTWVHNLDVVTRSVDLRLRQPGAPTISLTTLAIPAGSWSFGTVTAVAPLASLLAEVRVNAAEEVNLPLTFVVDDATFSGGVAAASPGDITLQLLTAIQARGRLTYLGTDFTATLDSAGNAWADSVLAVVVPRGQTLGGWLDELARWGYEWAVELVGSTWTLRVWNPAARIPNPGNTGAVVEGAHVPAGNTKTSIPPVTAVLAEGAAGLWDDTAENVTLGTALGVRDRYVYDEDVTDTATLASRGAAELAAAARYTAAGRFVVDGDAQRIPGLDYDVGDTIHVDADDLTGPQRVHAWSARLDENGARFTVEVNDRAAEDATLAAIALNRVLSQFERQRTSSFGVEGLGDVTTITTTVTAPWIVVAAFNAPQSWIDAANYVCDGINDEVEFRAALNLGGMLTHPDDVRYVQLSPGTFHWGASNGGAPLVAETAAGVEIEAFCLLRGVRGDTASPETPGRPFTTIVVDVTGSTAPFVGAPVLGFQFDSTVEDVALHVKGGTLNGNYRTGLLLDGFLGSSFARRCVVESSTNNAVKIIRTGGVDNCKIGSRLDALILDEVEHVGIRNLAVLNPTAAGVFTPQTRAAVRFQGSTTVRNVTISGLAVHAGGSDTDSAVLHFPDGNFHRRAIRVSDVRLVAEGGTNDWDWVVYRGDSGGTGILSGIVVDLPVSDATVPPYIGGKAITSGGVQQFTIRRVATSSLPPASSVPGELVYDTTASQLKISDGSSWVAVGP